MLKLKAVKGKESTALHNLITSATWLFDTRCGQKTPEGCPRSYDTFLWGRPAVSEREELSGAP